MSTPVVLAYDVGTSGVKAVVVDGAGRVLGSRVRTYGLETPRPGWVEQDLDVILAALGQASREVLELVGVDPARVVGVGLTAQMFSVVPVDGAGVALRPMLSWLDQRAAREAEALVQGVGGPDSSYAVFDTVLTAKDIVPRVAWLAANEPDITSRAAWFLDCKEAVVARLTGEIAIDPAGASAFRLVGPTGGWDAERCRWSGVATDRLPPIRPADAVIGGLTAEAAALTGLPAGTPVVTGAGDVPASQVGSGALGAGDVHLSLGTAVYFGITVDHEVRDPRARLGPLRHVVPGEWILWLEVATGGAALSWLDRQLAGFGGGGPRDHAAVDRAVEAAADEMEGLQFAPWLTGERVPLFDDSARAAFVGLALHHGPGHLVRAVMEGVASQVAWAFEYGLAYGIEPGAIRAVGGGSIGAAWTRIIAESLGRPLEVVADPQDAGARGAAACALVGLGLATDLWAAVPPRIERVVVPDADRVGAARARLEAFRGLYPALRGSSAGSARGSVNAIGADQGSPPADVPRAAPAAALS